MKYDECAGKCKKAIHSCNVSWESNLVDANKIGNFFQYVNKKLCGPKTVPPILDENGKLVTGPLVKAKTFNKYFASVFT